MRFSVVVIFLMSVFNIVNAQNFELLNVEFNSTLNDENSIGFKNTAIQVNLPVKLKKGILVNSLLFSTNSINYNSGITLNTTTIENFKTIKFDTYIKVLRTSDSVLPNIFFNSSAISEKPICLHCR